MWRSTAVANAGWRTTTRGRGLVARTWEWADTAAVLAADLLAGNEDPRATRPRCCAGRWPLSRRGPGRAGPAARGRGVLRRAVGPRRAFAEHRVRHRRQADRATVEDARRNRRDGLDRRDRHARRPGRGGQLLPELVAGRTRLLIRRVRLDVAGGQVSTDPRARRRRTCTPPNASCPCPNSPSSRPPKRSTGTRSS